MDTDERDPLISLSDAAHHFPKKNGKTMRLLTLRRWVKDGCRGRKIQAVIVGGRYFTRQSWVDAFVTPVTTKSPAELGREAKGGIVPRDARKAALVKRQLTAKGYYGAEAKNRLLGLPSKGGRPGRLHGVLSSRQVRDQDAQDDGRTTDRSGAAAALLPNSAERSAG
jgi:hypothetical protein